MRRTIIKYDLLVTIIAGLFDKTSIATCTGTLVRFTQVQFTQS